MIRKYYKYGILALGAFAVSAMGENMKEELINTIVKQGKKIIENELKKDQWVVTASNALNNLTYRYVFENEQVIAFTARNVEVLFNQDISKKWSKDAVARSIARPVLQDKLMSLMDYDISMNTYELKIQRRINQENKMKKIELKRKKDV